MSNDLFKHNTITMSQLDQQLSQAADHNRQLLAILHETDYAPPALKQNSAYIADLQIKISSIDKEITKLHDIIEKERKEHVDYRDSVMKRYAHKVAGKKERFAQKQEKEEREFLEAWQREREAQQRREDLTYALENAQKEKPGLEADTKEHNSAQSKLDQLYHSIFGGPTPEVPGEDQMEHTVEQARNWYRQSQTQLGNEEHAAEALQRANQYMSQALNDMNDSLDASDFDRFGGGTLFDAMERSALGKAQNNLTQCLRQMDEARHAQPAIGQLSDVNIDQGHFVSDVLFDNIFTDMAQHDRIEDSNAQVKRAMQQLDSTIGQQQQRVQGAQSQLQHASGHLEDVRRQLQQIRSEAFEQLAGWG